MACMHLDRVTRDLRQVIWILEAVGTFECAWERSICARGRDEGLLGRGAVVLVAPVDTPKSSKLPAGRIRHKIPNEHNDTNSMMFYISSFT